MQFNKFVSVSTIMEKVMRDTGFTDVTVGDAAEWTWECLGKIGTPALLSDEACRIDIDSKGIGVLPPNFIEEKFGGVRTFKDKKVLEKSAYSFFQDYAGFTNENKTTGNVTLESDRYNNLDDSVKWTDPNNMPYRLSHVYFIQGDYIYTGLSDETIEIAYKSIPCFADYTPMIPDNEKIKGAVEAYVIMKLMTREYYKGNVDRIKKEDAVQEYTFCAGQARNATIEPTVEDMRLIQNRMQALIKSTRSHETSGSIWGSKYNPGVNKQI